MGRIIRNFVCETHEEYGMLGLRPLWMPGTDPAPGMGAAHDILEHFPKDDGSVEAELMALAAVYWLRFESGWVASRGYGDRWVDNFGTDMLELYRHVVDEGYTLSDPGRTLALDDDTEDMFRRAVREGFRNLREDIFEEDVAPFCTKENERYILGWLRKGYRRVRKRYDGLDPFTIAECVFKVIETKVDNLLKTEPYEGMRVRIAVDLERLSVELNSDEMY